GLATDFVLHGTGVPRFGKRTVACGASRKAGAPDQPELWEIERVLNPEQYRTDHQKDGVRYAGEKNRSDIRYGTNEPLKPYQMGTRTFDYNVDGLAHMGLVPDMLQDMKNATKVDMQPLFSSAESYV